MSQTCNSDTFCCGVIPLDINDILSREDVPQDIKDTVGSVFAKYQESLDNLRKSEIHYRSLVENSREVIFTTDLEGNITSINSVAVKLTGFSVDEWLEENFAAKIHPDDLPGLIKGFQEVVKGIIPPTPEIRVLTKSGEYRVFEIKANPRIEDGRVVGVLGFAHCRQDFYASEARYRSLIQTMGEGVWVTDLENKTLYVNPALENICKTHAIISFCKVLGILVFLWKIFIQPKKLLVKIFFNIVKSCESYLGV